MANRKRMRVDGEMLPETAGFYNPISRSCERSIDKVQHVHSVYVFLWTWVHLYRRRVSHKNCAAVHQLQSEPLEAFITEGRSIVVIGTPVDGRDTTPLEWTSTKLVSVCFLEASDSIIMLTFVLVCSITWISNLSSYLWNRKTSYNGRSFLSLFGSQEAGTQRSHAKRRRERKIHLQSRQLRKTENVSYYHQTSGGHFVPFVVLSLFN